MADKTDSVIIGAGFSGTMVFCNLVKGLDSGASIVLVEKSGKFAQGVAYSTKDDRHYLNVRASAMGAFADAPNHFYEWLTNHNYVFKPECFVPRKLYALYLHTLFQEGLEEAKQKKVEVHLLTAEALDIQKQKDGILCVRLSNGNTIDAKTVVLATNFPSYKPFSGDPSLLRDRYIENIWDASGAHLLFSQDLEALPPETRIAIIGTGLTMVDATMSLIERNYRGKIIAISKNGCLPASHGEHFTYTLPPPTEAPRTALGLLKMVRKAVQKGEEQGYCWQAVISSLRSVTVPLWVALPLNEKKQFMRHLLSTWNKCRHRIPEEVHAMVKTCLLSNQLQVVSGKVVSLEKSDSGISIHVLHKPPLQADYVLNCSGPQLDVAKAKDPLFQHLVQEKLVEVDPLGMGIQVDDHFRIRKDLNVFALGQLLFGQYLETTAVPELRQQSKFIAEEIINCCVRKS